MLPGRRACSLLALPGTVQARRPGTVGLKESITRVSFLSSRGDSSGSIPFPQRSLLDFSFSS